MPALEDRPGPRHRGGVERGPHPEREALAERAARPVPDGVAVLPIPRRIARVEPGRHAPEVADRDVLRQERIERPAELLHPERPAVGEGDHLACRMDARVGPSRRVDPHPASAGERGQRGLELSLDRPGARLGLEPGEVRSVVFDPRAVAHGGTLSGALLVATAPAHRCVGTSARSLTHPGCARSRAPRRLALHPAERRHSLVSGQRSSIWTIGARSPFRLPRWVIRVYPEVRSAYFGAISSKSFLMTRGSLGSSATTIRRAARSPRLASVIIRSTSGRISLAFASVVFTFS